MEIDLAAAKRTPAMVDSILAQAEERARQRAADLRTLLSNPSEAREIFE
jgi:hypothetical protein